MKVCIDPGHYKDYNRGVITSYYEGNAMFYLAQYLEKCLNDIGIQTIITRKSITDNPSLEARGRKASGCDLFISLHSNAASTEAAKGIEVFYSVKRPYSKTLAEVLSENLTTLFSTTNRGVKTRVLDGSGNDYYGVIRSAANTDCKHIFIIEHGFHTNSSECRLLNRHDFLLKIAEMEAEIIKNYFSCPVNEVGVEDIMTKSELKKFILDVLREENPHYAEIKDVPDYWKGIVQDLLDSNALNGGTPKEVNPNDIHINRDALQGIIIALNYLKNKGVIK